MLGTQKKKLISLLSFFEKVFRSGNTIVKSERTFKDKEKLEAKSSEEEKEVKGKNEDEGEKREEQSRKTDDENETQIYSEIEEGNDKRVSFKTV